MDIDKFGLPPAVSEAAEAAGYGSMTERAAAVAELAFGKGRDALVVTRSGPAGEAVWLLPLLRWIGEMDGRRALTVAVADEHVGGALDRIRALAGPAGLETTALGRIPDASDADASIVVCAAPTLAARLGSGSFDLDGFGLLLVLDAERQEAGAIDALAARPGADGARRVLAFCERPGAGARRVVDSLAPGAETLELDAGADQARLAPRRILRSPSADKPRLAAGLIRSGAAGPVAVLCNLGATARDLHATLRDSGLASKLVDEGIRPGRALDLLRGAKGARTAFVMTDDQVPAFPHASFPLVISYDLPLEGEPWLARSLLLDLAAPDAELVGIACERYDFGLPAIERVLGSSLAVSDADPSLFAELEVRPAAGDRGRERADERRRDGSRREGGAREEQRGAPRGGQRDRREQRGERRTGGEGPDPQAAAAIRAGISAITGQLRAEVPARVAAEANPERADGRAPEPGARKRRKRGRGKSRPSEGSPASAGPGRSGTEARAQRPAGGEGGGAEGRRGKGGRKGDGRRGSGAGGTRREGARRANEPGALEGADPYALPMEERLRLYREKYASGKPGSGRREGPKRQGVPGGSKRPDGRKIGPDRTPRAGSQENREPARRDPAPKRSGEAPGAPDEAKARKGFFGRIFGAQPKGGK
ncbi:MAG: hypothetical protein JXA15_11530 [Spirochaetales bacterium]|nr:hypothetical protein [Spirochaetales bacterium]